jgi:hypothetical protein
MLRGADLALPSGHASSATDNHLKLPVSAYDTLLLEHLSRLLRAYLSSLCLARGVQRHACAHALPHYRYLIGLHFSICGYEARVLRCPRYAPEKLGIPRTTADLPRCGIWCSAEPATAQSTSSCPQLAAQSMRTATTGRLSTQKAASLGSAQDGLRSVVFRARGQISAPWFRSVPGLCLGFSRC